MRILSQYLSEGKQGKCLQEVRASITHQGASQVPASGQRWYYPLPAHRGVKQSVCGRSEISHSREEIPHSSLRYLIARRQQYLTHSETSHPKCLQKHSETFLSSPRSHISGRTKTPLTILSTPPRPRPFSNILQLACLQGCNDRLYCLTLSQYGCTFNTCPKGLLCQR